MNICLISYTEENKRWGLSMQKKPTAISIFSGAGGFDLGIEASGFETRFCSDIDSHSCKTLRFNRRFGRRTQTHSFLSKAVVLQRDIKNLTSGDILRAARLKVGETSLVYGGPPCQSFSVFGLRKGMDDPRGALLWDFIRVIREVQPEAFIFENVAGLLSIDNGNAFEVFLNQLSCDQSGIKKYTLSHYLLDAANYGVPQYRSRLIVFGTKSGIKVSKPPPSHAPRKEQKALTPFPATPVVKQILSSLPKIPCDKIPNHIGRMHSQRIIDRYTKLEYGERDCKTRINRLHPHRPSFTIVVGSDKGGGKGHIHPTEPREVTPRESARIQTFPDYWAFSGTSRHPIRQVGNAVPPVFAAALGSHVLNEVFGYTTVPTYKEVIDILQLEYMPCDTEAEFTSKLA